MSLLNKIFTALRGGAREAGEAIVDANGIRIFEQEIRESENHLAQAKRDLTGVIAKEMQASREVERLQSEITKHEEYAVKALEKKDEALALEIAEQIASFTENLALQKQAKTSFTEHGKRLKDLIKQTEKGLADMNRQLTMVKATASVQKATSAIADNFASSDSKLLSAKESLDRIQKRQQENDDRLKAGESLQNEFSGQDLKDRMKAAGIGETKDSAADILAKLKERKDNV